MTESPQEPGLNTGNEAESREQGEKAEGAQLNLLETCAVCKLNFQSRDPKLLPCLHSFCKKCLPEPLRHLVLPGAAAAGSLTDSSPPQHQQIGVIRCPVCHQECRQPDIIDNYFVKDTTEVPSSTDEKFNQVCTSCEDNAEASGFCVECLEWLCKTCIEAHQRVKFTKDHTVRQKKDVSPEAVSVSNQRMLFCPVHRQEQLKLFCETCDRLTCRDCQLLEHKEHRYQFLEEAFKNQKVIIDTLTAKLQEKRNYIQYAATQIQNRINEVNENCKKVEQDIKVAVFTLMIEINKKGKALLQQLESVTKDRQAKLLQQQLEISGVSKQVEHVMNFAKWAISNRSSIALLYSKRLITFQLRYILRARCDASPVATSSVRFHCDPTFWAKNVLNLGSLVLDKNPPASSSGPNVPTGLSMQSQDSNTAKVHGQINLAQLRLQHMQQQVMAQRIQQRMHQMRPILPVAQQPRPPGPHLGQQQPPLSPNSQSLQPPRLISLQSLQRSNTNVPPPPAQQMRMPPNTVRMTGPQQHIAATSPLMRQHYNPGNVRPFLVASSTAPSYPSMLFVTASEASKHLIPMTELLPAVTNPEHLSCLPDIPQIQLDDAGSVLLESLLTRERNGNSVAARPSATSTNPSPGPSIPSPGHSGSVTITNVHIPGRTSSTSSTGSRGSCTSSSRLSRPEPQQMTPVVRLEPIKIKQETVTEDDLCDFPIIVVKQEPGEEDTDHCELTNPQNSSTSLLPGKLVSDGQTVGHRDRLAKVDPPDSTASPSSNPGDSQDRGTQPPGASHKPARVGGDHGKEDDPNEDWCAVCQNGGDLLCCEKCPKVFHLVCHVPALLSFPSGEWICTFCRDPVNPEVMYDCEDQWQMGEKRKVVAVSEMTPVDQRKCENLLLSMYCDELSVAFQEPVPASVVPDYYKIIKKPMDMCTVKMKLQRQHSQHYNTAEEFVGDIRLIFKNCEEFNEPDSEVAHAGKTLEQIFESKLMALFPDRTFPPLPPTKVDSESPKVNIDSEDDDDDVVQPRRKRCKGRDSPIFIK
ncbi:E3 ubiquitin-protein ligase TRIM33-like isoform X1 [Chiloscyllium plagiosum]|uniref:E3 ubiquitin-protein ligase TRIM33-like isoform X1 n=1 Tax=Chiloscyllium plagiosum TaxID=36176 RepID=UPI001CB7B787|nr:E3 ubiquitin-protein ligase TRIM33-like isoform X1 [Chiloscyllium plagiosum]